MSITTSSRWPTSTVSGRQFRVYKLLYRVMTTPAASSSAMSSSLESLSSSSSPSSGAPSPSLNSCDAGGWLHPGHIFELLAHGSHSMRYAKCTRFRRHAVQFPVLPARMALYLPYAKRHTTYSRIDVMEMYR